MESRDTLYLNPNRDNTEATIEAARKRALELELKYIVVASSTGSTGVKVAKAFKGSGIKVVVVTLFATSTTQPNPGHMAKIRELGAEVLTSTHALMGVPESLAKIKQGYVTPNTMIREVLRRFSQGTNVVADIVMMATDSGVIPEGVEVMAIAGMGNNADTAWVLRASGSFNFFDKINGLEFRELVALPRTKKFW